MFRIVLGISGASGSIYGRRLLERLQRVPDIETHLVLTRAAERTLFLETGQSAGDLRALANVVHPVEDIGSSIASGSFLTNGMVIAPCSIHTMSAIATGITSNLLIRAADVCLKERRKLILMVRESPFHLGHLKTMVSLTEMGAIIAPPIPSFYSMPKSVDEIVNASVERALDLLGLPIPDAARWNGREAPRIVTKDSGERS